MKIINNKYQAKSREFVERFPNYLQIVDWFGISVENKMQYKKQPSKFPCIYSNDEMHNFEDDTELIELLKTEKTKNFEILLNDMITKAYTPSQQQVLILEALSGNEDAIAVQQWLKDNLAVLKSTINELLLEEDIGKLMRYKIELIEKPDTLKSFIDII